MWNHWRPSWENLESNTRVVVFAQIVTEPAGGGGGGKAPTPFL
jgi:hypothetical protein